MAASCFGEVVNDATLDEFGIAKTKQNRAKIAMRFMYNDDKKGQAIRHVNDLKRMYGKGSSTLCIVYNASGDTLRFSAAHNWYGGSFYNQGYPEVIGNGQWAAFLHVHNQGAATGSVGTVVYTGKNRQGQDRDFLLAWCTPWSEFQTNKAYCKIGPVNFYDGRWDEIENTLEGSQYSSNDTADGIAIEAHTERGTSPNFNALIKEE